MTSSQANHPPFSTAPLLWEQRMNKQQLNLLRFRWSRTPEGNPQRRQALEHKMAEVRHRQRTLKFFHQIAHHQRLLAAASAGVALPPAPLPSSSSNNNSSCAVQDARKQAELQHTQLVPGDHTIAAYH